MKNVFTTLAALALIAASTSANAQTSLDSYPSKPVRLVIGFAPGGVSDIIGRALAAALAEPLGQAVIVDNRPGANGTIGAAAVATAPPDGYTLLLPSLSTVAISPNFLARVPYDPLGDFTPIGGIATTPNILVANATLPIRSLTELIAFGKGEGKGKLAYASSGTGSTGHLSGEVLRMATGVDMTHVTYKSSALAFPDVIAGRVSMVFDSLPSTLSYIRNGNLRPIALMADRRSALLPDVPTFAESGFPSATLLFWVGIDGPPGVPDAIVQKLNAALRQVLATPGLRERLAGLGAETMPLTPQAFADLRRRDVARVKKVIQDAGIKPE